MNKVSEGIIGIKSMTCRILLLCVEYHSTSIKDIWLAGDNDG